MMMMSTETDCQCGDVWLPSRVHMMYYIKWHTASHTFRSIAKANASFRRMTAVGTWKLGTEDGWRYY